MQRQQSSSSHNGVEEAHQYREQDDATYNFANFLVGECREIIMNAFEKNSKKYPPHQQLKEFIAEAPFTALKINNTIVNESTNLRIRTQRKNSPIQSIQPQRNKKNEYSDDEDERAAKRTANNVPINRSHCTFSKKNSNKYQKR